MDERVKYQGNLYEAEKRAKKTAIRLAALRDDIRDKCDPFAALIDIPADEVAELAVAFASQMIEYSEILLMIAALKKTLGE